MSQKIKLITINAKCSDLCFITYYDEDENELGERDGYVPDFFPDGGGDYVSLDIDVETGRIVDWKKPTQKELKDSMDS
jgi:hypothetical protein